MSIGCGRFLVCLSSLGIHVVTSSIFRCTNDDIGAYLKLVASFYSGHACDNALRICWSSSLHTYIRGTQNNHAWFKLNFNAYFEHVITCKLLTRYYLYETRMLNYIVQILIDFTYRLPDFVLTIILLTLSCLPLLSAWVRNRNLPIFF